MAICKGARTSEQAKQRGSLTHTVQDINKSHTAASFALLAQHHISQYRLATTV